MISRGIIVSVLLFFSLRPLLGHEETVKRKATFLVPGRVVKHTPDEWSLYKPGLLIYCYAGQPPTLLNAFCTVAIRMNCDHDNFNQYAGGDPEEVERHWNDDQSLFSFNVFASNKRRQVELEPFNQSCLGIVSSGKYEIEVLLNRFDLWRFGLLVLGLLLFSSARAMSQNSFFYYFGGVLLGLVTFALALVYFFSKLMPYRPLMLGFMVGGWTLGVYGMQLLYENLRLIFIQYQHYVFWYLAVVGSGSFLICYRLGPPKDQRSKQVIQWGLQLIGLTAIFFCSYQRTLSTGLVLLVFIGNFMYLPLAVLRWVRNRFRRRFPGRRRLLTVEEFEEQGRIETDKALNQLREFCRSPECKQWATMTKLREPVRFASFVEGTTPHVLEEECTEYDMHYSSQSGQDSEELSEDEEEET